MDRTVYTADHEDFRDTCATFLAKKPPKSA